MNLHGIASGAIGAINPLVAVTIRVSSGYTTGPAGARVPTYLDPAPTYGQVQPLSSTDIQMLSSLNIQGSQKALYITGHVEGLVRVERRGGDIVILPDGTVWLVTTVLEAWPDWTKVAMTRQNQAAPPIGSDGSTDNLPGGVP